MSRILSILFLAITICSNAQYITVKEGRFFIGNEPYYYMGTNYWYGMNIASKGEGGDRDRLLRELNQLKANGVTNLRVVAASEGPNDEPYRIVPALMETPGVYNQDLLEGLDFLLNEMSKRGLKAVLCMGNMWPWSGGFDQYLVWNGIADSIPYPPPHPGGDWDKYQQFTSQFYEDSASMKQYEAHLKKIITRTNSVNGRSYFEDETIMSWELCNEPRGMKKIPLFHSWIQKSTDYIRSLDKNHLITVGSEGSTSDASYAGMNFKKDHDFPNVDYMTIHIWVENWNWFDPEKVKETYDMGTEKALAYLNKHVQEASELGKPVVLEEFGIARDNRSYSPFSSVKIRDKYYATMFSEIYKLAKSGSSIGGVNFWAYAGEGRPKAPFGLIWNPGQDFIGDPPHEHQGWYSVYGSDVSTLKVIKKASNKLSKIKL